MAFPAVQVLPQPAAGQARAEDYKQMAHSDSYGYFDFHYGKLTATPSPGWAFDHWEWEWENTTGTKFQFQSTKNPFEADWTRWVTDTRNPPFDTVQGNDPNKYLYFGDVDYDHTSGTPAYKFTPGSVNATWIKAVFTRSSEPTGLIIYDTANGKVMCGQAGTVLYDDGTTDS